MLFLKDRDENTKAFITGRDKRALQRFRTEVHSVDLLKPGQNFCCINREGISEVVGHAPNSEQENLALRAKTSVRAVAVRAVHLKCDS